MSKHNDIDTGISLNHSDHIFNSDNVLNKSPEEIMKNGSLSEDLKNEFDGETLEVELEIDDDVDEIKVSKNENSSSLKTESIPTIISSVNFNTSSFPLDQSNSDNGIDHQTNGASIEDNDMEASTIQFEDGSTAILRLPKNSSAIQAITLENGTAYITTNNSEGLFNGEHVTLEQANFDIEQLTEQGSVTNATFLNQLDPGNSSDADSQSKSENGKDAERLYQCDFMGCKKVYSTLTHLKVHLRTHTGEKPYKCSYDDCGKSFATSYTLKSHLRVHTGERPYKCPTSVCNKAFKTSGDLQKHIRVHTGEKPYQCPVEGCNKYFTTSNIRKVHIRTHTGERPYVCDYRGCKKSFASATNYNNHCRIHSGLKPYVCTVPSCNRRFTEYSSLYKHQVVHSEVKPYECSHCGKTYRQTSTLAMHKRSAHDDTSPSIANSSLLLQTAAAATGQQPSVARDDDHGGYVTRSPSDDSADLVINTSDGELLVRQQSSDNAPLLKQENAELTGGVNVGAGDPLQPPTQQLVLVACTPEQLEAIKLTSVDGQNIQILQSSVPVIGREPALTLVGQRSAHTPSDN